MVQGINHSSIDTNSEDFHSQNIPRNFIQNQHPEKRLSKHEPGRLTVIDEVREHTKSDLDFDGGENNQGNVSDTSIVIPPLHNYHEQDSDSDDSRNMRSDSEASDIGNLSKFLEHGVDNFLIEEEDDVETPDPIKQSVIGKLR